MSQSKVVLVFLAGKIVVNESQQFESDYRSNNVELQRRSIERHLSLIDIVEEPLGSLIGEKSLVVDQALGNARLAVIYQVENDMEKSKYHAGIALESFMKSGIKVDSIDGVYEYIEEFDRKVFKRDGFGG